MPQPFNYMLPDPSASVMQGVQQGLNFAQMKGQLDLQRQTQEANTLALADKQRAAEQIKLMQADLAQASKNPSPAMFASMIMKYPQLSEHFKRGYDIASPEQQKTRIQQATQVHAAQLSGNHEMAQKLLLEQSEAYANSGMEQEAKTAKVIAETMAINPSTALTSTGLMLAATTGPEKYIESFTHLQNEQRNAAKAPAELSEAQSKASKAAVDSKYAESNAVKELEKKGWDIYKIQEDVKINKENTRIAAANAGLAREGNTLKRQELGLRIDEMKLKRDEIVRTKAADIESAYTNMDNMLNTADRILKMGVAAVDPKTGEPTDFTALARAATGPVDSLLPTMQRDVADFEQLVETLGSQSFLAQIPNIKGMGALSDAEGKKLQSALQNFSLKQSPKQLMMNVREAQRLILKARKNVANRYGVPNTVPDTPAAGGSRKVDDLVNKYVPNKPSGATGSW